MEFVKSLMHFNPIVLHNPYFYISILIFLISILLCSFEKYKVAITTLIIGALILNLGIIQLDPFLNSWDERFHALVAKNLIRDPLRPMLYVNPLLEYDLANWCGNHIWLHKQPLFLWQMSLSIKIFGPNEVAARLPSAIMLCILSGIVFRMGMLMFNERVGFIAALLLVSNNFILEHLSGRQQLEHNDIAFMFYVTLSIWSWLEYEKAGNKLWLIGMGIFSGCAILNKWLPGLLVYSGYGFYHILLKKDFSKRAIIVNTLSALVCTLLVALPWQIFTYLKYPTETYIEYSLNSKHLFNVIEGHSGSVFFYITNLGEQFSFLELLLLFGICIGLWKFYKNSFFTTCLFIVLIIYIFFSLVASKMPSFVMPVQPLCYVFIALGVDFLFQLFYGKKGIRVVLSVTLFFLFSQNINFGKMAAVHWRNTENYWGNFLQNTTDNTLLYKNLNKTLSNDYVIAYCNQFEEIDCMYYSGITSYSYLDKDKILQLKMLRKRIAVFNANLPDFIIGDSSIYILPYKYGINPNI